MTTLDTISNFMKQKHIAIAGVSRKPGKFGNAVFKELAKKDITMYPIHRELDHFQGVPCYKDVAALPSDVSALIICTRPADSLNLLKAAAARDIRHIWLQQGAEDKECIRYAAENNLNLVNKQCILMYAEPAGFIHRFHRGINKLFGKFPK